MDSCGLCFRTAPWISRSCSKSSWPCYCVLQTSEVVTHGYMQCMQATKKWCFFTQVIYSQVWLCLSNLDKCMQKHDELGN